LTRFVNRGTQGVTGPGAGTVFYDASSASSGIFVNEASSTPYFGGGQTLFYNNSTAANGTFTNNGGIVLGGYGAETIFSDNSTAGNGTFTNNGGTVAGSPSFIPGSFGGITLFRDTSTAANGLFINNSATAVIATGGLTLFWNNSTAANGTFINNGGAVTALFGTAGGGATLFVDNATAANGTFTNNGGTVSGAGGGRTDFAGSATAYSATFINNGGTVSGAGGGETHFHNTSTAANGTFTNNGGTVSGAGGCSTVFHDSSTAASAILVANGGSNGGQGGAIVFADESTLGTAQIEIFGNGSLDISLHDAPGMTIDSIHGDGNVLLGANNLTVGSDNSDTTFACAIQDGGRGGGVGGSLTKIGSGTLQLTGANTYTGDTNVNGGVLKIDGSITSNTFVRHHSTLGGTGTINANLTNVRGTVSPGGPGMPGVLTVVHDYTQQEFATLMIQIAGTSAGDFSVLNVLGNANLNGYLDPVLLNGFVPTIGDSFTFLNYGSLTGEFSQIQHQVFNHGMLQWSVSYQNTFAILTVEQHVPDQGSTLLLLTLGLLGLVAYRRQLLRGQP
jgi:autotransporter-associated beta strand protein